MKRLFEILTTYDTEPVELANSLVMIYLGITLLNPASTFTSNNVSYAAMASVMCEEAWGILLLLTGVTGIVAVSLNVKAIRMIVSAIKLTVFVWWGVLYFVSNPLTTGGTYAVLGLAAGWCFVRRFSR